MLLSGMYGRARIHRSEASIAHFGPLPADDAFKEICKCAPFTMHSARILTHFKRLSRFVGNTHYLTVYGGLSRNVFLCAAGGAYLYPSVVIFIWIFAPACSLFDNGLPILLHTVPSCEDMEFASLCICCTGGAKFLFVTKPYTTSIQNKGIYALAMTLLPYFGRWEWCLVNSENTGVASS